MVGFCTYEDKWTQLLVIQGAGLGPAAAALPGSRLETQNPGPPPEARGQVCVRTKVGEALSWIRGDLPERNSQSTGALRPGRPQSSQNQRSFSSGSCRPFHPSVRASNPNLRDNPGVSFWVKISGAHCKDKYKFKIKGLIPPVENKGRDFPLLLFLRALTLENL